MNILRNRTPLKAITALNIDSQIAQKLGAEVFSYSGEPTHAYYEACAQLQEIVSDLSSILEIIKTSIPDAQHSSTLVHR